MRAWGTSQAELIRLPSPATMPVFVLTQGAAAMMWNQYRAAYARNAVLVCKILSWKDGYVVVPNGPHFENKMLTDEYRTLRRPKWWTLDYPVLRLSHIDDDFGEVVDHECYGNCRLSHCFWPNGPLDKGIARMQENYRRKKNNKRDDYLVQVFRTSSFPGSLGESLFRTLILSFLPSPFHWNTQRPKGVHVTTQRM